MWDDAVDHFFHVLLSLVGLIPFVIVGAVAPVWWAWILAGTASGFWFAWWREDAQHRGTDGWDWPLEGSGGRWLDMVFGTAGGTLAGALLAVVL